MKHTYMIINMETKAYITDPAPNFDGEWKELYPHTKGASWMDVCARKIWDFERANGIPTIHDLCCDGAMYEFLVDADMYDDEAIKKAEEYLRNKEDVVSLHIIKLKKYEGEHDGNNRL